MRAYIHVYGKSPCYQMLQFEYGGPGVWTEEDWCERFKLKFATL